MLYVASEESAIREICPHPEESWMPLAGEPVVARVSEKGRQKAIAQTRLSAGQRRAARRAWPSRKWCDGVHHLHPFGIPRGHRQRGLPTVRPLCAAVRLERLHLRRAGEAAHPRPHQVRGLPPLRYLLPRWGDHHQEERPCLQALRQHVSRPDRRRSGSRPRPGAYGSRGWATIDPICASSTTCSSTPAR